MGSVIATVPDNSYRGRRDNKLFCKKNEDSYRTHPLAWFAICDDCGRAAPPANRGVVSLPEGFEYIPKQGDDSIIGLFRKDATEIDFDFGFMAGVYVDTMMKDWEDDETVSVVRNSTMIIAGQPIKILVYSRGDLKGAIISWPDSLGNFFCTYRDDGELADFFALALSFRPDQKTAEQGGAGQPDTRSKLDSEGGQKPQLESKGRSQ
ncbi:MAG: hypothetical protein ABL994_16665 [Verrucomicrobiales bacterium]